MAPNRGWGLSIIKWSTLFLLHTVKKKWDPPEVSFPLCNSRNGAVYTIWANLGNGLMAYIETQTLQGSFCEELRKIAWIMSQLSNWKNPWYRFIWLTCDESSSSSSWWLSSRGDAASLYGTECVALSLEWAAIVSVKPTTQLNLYHRSQGRVLLKFWLPSSIIAKTWCFT